MAAIQPANDFIAAPASAMPRRRSGVRKPSTTGRAAAAIVAVACAIGGLVVARAYPIAPTGAMAAFVAWALFAAARVSIAFPAVLALLPVVGFAPLTGWLTFEELDLLILATACGGYAARAVAPPPPPDRDAAARLSVFAMGAMALFAVSLAIALVRGIDDAGGLHFDWFQGYDDPLNSVRIAKSFVWTLLLAPLVASELRKPGGSDRFALGMTSGLAVCALAVLQERIAFTGLLDFSDDYRVTAPFWEMHTGGAALDGFLALTIPFAFREIVRHETRARLVAGWLVLGLAGYACLVTFSRGVYAAVPVALLLATVLVFRQRVRLDRRASWALLARGLAFALVVAVCGFIVFRQGGYRAVIAVFAVLVVAIPVESAIRRTGPASWLAAAIGAAVVGAAGTLVGSVLPKGPYLLDAAALVAAIACVVLDERRPTRSTATLAIGAWLWLAMSAGGVAVHWGGRAALRDTGLVLAGLVALSFAMSRTARSMWPQQRHERLATVGFAAAVMAAVAVFSAGAYMGGRFSTTRGDLDVRIAHWTQGIARLHGAADWWLGKGLGRFPATSLFGADDGSIRGDYRLAHRGGETFVALSSPKIRYLGFFQWLRLSQRVTVRPQTTYTAIVRVRSAEDIGLHVELCQKQLLYPGPCAFGYGRFNATTDVDRKAGNGGWKEGRFPLATGGFGPSPWYAPRPVFFAVAADGPPVEIRSLQLVGPDGVDVLENGDFSNRTARWFSSSDRHHLPWHIKNLLLDVLFDQGIFGLGAFVLLVGAAFVRTAVGRAFRHPDAPYIAAAITGYVIVGAFDSLLDVPRVAFAFFAVVAVGLMLRAPRVSLPERAASIEPAASAPPPTTPPDEAAERAKRRQRAFGARRAARG